MPLIPSSERHSSDWAKEKDTTVIVVSRVDETPWRNVELTGANRTPSPATIAMVNNVLGLYQAVTEQTQPVAGEHPSIRRTQGENSGGGVRAREVEPSPVG
jgi:hypothetical protein